MLKLSSVLSHLILWHGINPIGWCKFYNFFFFFFFFRTVISIGLSRVHNSEYWMQKYESCNHMKTDLVIKMWCIDKAVTKCFYYNEWIGWVRVTLKHGVPHWSAFKKIQTQTIYCKRTKSRYLPLKWEEIAKMYQNLWISKYEG